MEHEQESFRRVSDPRPIAIGTRCEVVGIDGSKHEAVYDVDADGIPGWVPALTPKVTPFQYRIKE